MHAAIIVESGVAIIIAITIAINMSLTLKSTAASFFLGRGAVPSGESIGDISGLGTSTICSIVSEVCQALVDCLWEEEVSKHMPTCET